MKEYFQPKEFGLSLENGISHKCCWFNEEFMYLPSTQLWSVWSDILCLFSSMSWCSRHTMGFSDVSNYPCVHPIKQLAQDVTNATRRLGGLVNHTFFRKGQRSSKRGQILILLNKILAKNVLVCFLVCQGRENGLLSSLQKI